MHDRLTRFTSLEELRHDVVGLNTHIPLLDGTRQRFVFLDNAASTPTFHGVMRCIEEFLPWYAGVHRGIGYKAVVATNVYEETHRIAGEFVGADFSKNCVVFGKNTTELVNKLAARFDHSPRGTVVSTLMEHHSNDLPWRKFFQVVHVGIGADGSLDLDRLQAEIAQHRGNLRLVAVSGASNVTGICNPIHTIAGWAHQAGAKIFVDAAQLAPHRRIDILPDDDPGHLDFIAFSAHKIYAPFGIGVLIGSADFFAAGEPDSVGGGTVSYVGTDEVEWAGVPQKEEAGSPNVVGAVALAESLKILSSIGMETVARHENTLLRYALDRIGKIPGIRIYGPTEDLSQKVGVIPFNVDGLDHALVATILSAEGAIGVRNGNFCAQPYMRKLLGVTPEEEKSKRASRCDNPTLPGMVRASLGCYNNEEDVTRLVVMLERIARREYAGKYSIDPATGTYTADGYAVHASNHFRFFNPQNSPLPGEEVA